MIIKGRAEIIAHKHIRGLKEVPEDQKVKDLATDIKQFVKDSNDEFFIKIKEQQQTIKDAISLIDFAQSKINKLINEYEQYHGK